MVQHVNGVELLERPTDQWSLLRTGAYHVGLQNLYLNGALQALITADVLYAMPFWVPRTTIWDSIAIEIIIAGVGGTDARLGIYYDGDNMYPGDLLLDAGLVDVDGVAMVAKAIDVQLTPGRYHLALVSDGQPALNYGDAQIHMIGATIYGQATMGCMWTVAHGFAALPDPFTGGGALAGGTWKIGLRLNSFV